MQSCKRNECFRTVKSASRTRLAQPVAVIALLCVSASAGAQDAYHCIDTLSDEEVSENIHIIEETFRRGKHKALGWRIGWIGGFLAGGGALAALAVEANNDNRPWDRFAFAYQAAGGAAFAIGFAAVPWRDAWGLKRIRRQPSDTLEQRRSKLRYATRQLERGAKQQAFLADAGGVALSVAFGVAGGTAKAVKWSGKTPGFTALMFVLPPALAIGNVLSAPTNLRDGWEGYRANACHGKYYDRGAEDLEFDLGLSPTGIRFSIQF
ncbi:MAG: hypothetical protein AAF500_05785 [Myxococcota bacterium]